MKCHVGQSDVASIWIYQDLAWPSRPSLGDSGRLAIAIETPRNVASADGEPDQARRSRGGRPTRAAAAERDERLVEIATAMFMEHGFEATSMDRLAEAAAIGKATLYARYSDKAALFADVLRRRILAVYEPIEEEFAVPIAGADLGGTLSRVAARLLEKGLSPEAITLGRMLSAQGPRFPDLARLAVQEGFGRQTRLVEAILAPYAVDRRFVLNDLPLAADLFLSLVLGRASRLKIYGIGVDHRTRHPPTPAAGRRFKRRN